MLPWHEHLPLPCTPAGSRTVKAELSFHTGLVLLTRTELQPCSSQDKQFLTLANMGQKNPVKAE